MPRPILATFRYSYQTLLFVVPAAETLALFFSKAMTLRLFEIWALSGTWVALVPTTRTTCFFRKGKDKHQKQIVLPLMNFHCLVFDFGVLGVFQTFRKSVQRAGTQLCSVFQNHAQEDFRTLVEFANRPWAFNVDCKAQCVERTFAGAEKKPPVKLVIFDFDGALTLYTFMPEDPCCTALLLFRSCSNMFKRTHTHTQTRQPWFRKDPRCSTDIRFTPNEWVKQRYASEPH